MNDIFDSDAHYTEFGILNQNLALLLGSYKEAGNYFERYLTQLSKEEFLNIVNRL